jgi:hypothetical protein
MGNAEKQRNTCKQEDCTEGFEEKQSLFPYQDTKEGPGQGT